MPFKRKYIGKRKRRTFKKKRFYRKKRKFSKYDSAVFKKCNYSNAILGSTGNTADSMFT